MQNPLPLHDGTSLPWPIYGSGTSLRNTDASTPVAAALTAGFRHIDCAQMYANEDSVGAGLARSGVPRAALFVTTKLTRVPPGQTAADTLRASLARMRLEYVDLFLVHEPGVHEDLCVVWREMEVCKAEGLARSIGVSNFRIRDLEVIREGCGSMPTVNQIELHPYIYKASIPVLQYMKEHNIAPTSFAGLAPLWRISDGALNPVLDGIASRLSQSSEQTVTQAQVLQLWLRKKHIPFITTTSKPERLQEFLDVANIPDISDEDEQRIDEAGSTAHHRFFCKYIDES